LREQYLIDAFYFIDDLFTLKKDNVKQFCGLLCSEKLNIVWGCSSKVNTVDLPTLTMMRDAGCVQIDFGVEKGSDQALARLKKGITTQQIKATFSHCRSLGIRTFANILINTPGETSEDLNDICTLLDEIRANVVSINIFTPYPGCEIYDGSGTDLNREQYAWLMRNPADLVAEMPARFRFAAHDVDIREWARSKMKQYNLVRRNVSVFFDARYLYSLIHSRRKSNYMCQLVLLFREFCNQRF